MSTERDELADMVGGPSRENGLEVADAILAAGYRKIFDGDCGLGNAAPDERDAAEAWMRWANILNIGGDEERNGIAAMKQMLTEFGYRKPRTVTTVEELAGLGGGTIIRAVKSEHNPHGLCFEKYGKEWLALDPADREDGEVTMPHTAVLKFYGAHSITVLFTPENAS